MSYQQFGSILNPATGQNCQRRKLLNTDSPFLTYKKLSQPNPNLTQKPYKTQRKRNDLVESTPMVISMDSTEATIITFKPQNHTNMIKMTISKLPLNPWKYLLFGPK